jgi:nucleotide-binding universal stress UspA family protein
MTPGGTPAGVVVGFGADGRTEDMLDWAAAEAATRGCPLRLLHVTPPPPPTDPYGFLVTDVEALVGLRNNAERRLRQALSRARAVAPDIDVTARLAQGSVIPILINRARGAAMLVLGRGLRDERGLLARSVSARVSSRAGCPVVVVGPSPAPASGSPPRVVVGIDPAASCTAAVGFAFGAARQRGIPLVAVRAWTPEPPADLEPIAVPTAMAEMQARRTLDQSLARWQIAYRDVSVHTVIVRGDPARVLQTQSRGAALLVVGTRGRGALHRTVFGSVSQTLLEHASCPLAVIHRGIPTSIPTGVPRLPGRGCEPAGGDQPSPRGRPVSGRNSPRRRWDSEG